MDEVYKIFSWGIAGILFLASWLFCIVKYGFFMGVVFGWIPALIVGAVAWFFWPVAVVIVAGLYLLLK